MSVSTQHLPQSLNHPLLELRLEVELSLSVDPTLQVNIYIKAVECVYKQFVLLLSYPFYIIIRNTIDTCLLYTTTK